MGIEPNTIFIGNWIWIGIGAVCHLSVCYIQLFYLSESERKSDSQCEQAVSVPVFFTRNSQLQNTLVLESEVEAK